MGVGTLVLGYGNPGRLDDGLGPALAEAVGRAGIEGVEVEWDYQANVEHAADVARHGVVVFADASVSGEGAYSFRRLEGRGGLSFSTHAVGPEAVVAIARDALGWEGEAYLLGVRGEVFDGFGEVLSEAASAHLGEAAGRLCAALREGRLEGLVTGAPTDVTTDAHCGGGAAWKTEST